MGGNGSTDGEALVGLPGCISWTPQTAVKETGCLAVSAAARDQPEGFTASEARRMHIYWKEHHSPGCFPFQQSRLRESRSAFLLPGKENQASRSMYEDLFFFHYIVS